MRPSPRRPHGALHTVLLSVRLSVICPMPTINSKTETIQLLVREEIYQVRSN